MTGRLIGVAAALAIALTACTPAAQPSPGAPTGPAPSGSPTATPSTPVDTATPEPSSHPFTFETLPRFDGSTANIPLISLVIQRLTGASAAEADNAVSVTTTPNAYRALVAGETDLLLVYEADETVKQEVAESGVELEPIRSDATRWSSSPTSPIR